MKQYIGTKIVQAEAMSRGEYNEYRGWSIPTDENPADEGYMLHHESGRKSWTPKAEFEAAYRRTDGLSFGLALEAVKMGKRISRSGWNGKGMYVFLADDVEFHTNADISEFYGAADGCCVASVLVMRTAQGNMQPGWLASQADMLADDWYIVE